MTQVKPIRIVVADDHAILRAGVCELLRKEADITVVGEAATGREAIETVRNLSPNIAVMDLRMPDMNGIDAAREIRQKHPATRVVALSSSTDPATVRLTMSAGASAFVAKASAFEELVNAIRSVTGGRIYFSPNIDPDLADVDGNGAPELTPRELEVLQLLAGGQTTKGAAMSLNLSAKTIETHRRNLMRKLELDNLADLTKYAIRAGLASVE